MSPDTSARRPPSSPVTFAGGASSKSAGGAVLSPIAGYSPLSAISGRFSSLVTGGGPLSTVSDRFLSLIAGGRPSSAILGHFLSPIAGRGPSFAVSVRLLSPMSLAGSRTLFLTSIPSCTHCSSLPSLRLFHSSLSSLLTPLARNPAQLNGKRLFDPAFITQRPITSKQQQIELDLSFEQCSYSVSVKINRSW